MKKINYFPLLIVWVCCVAFSCSKQEIVEGVPSAQESFGVSLEKGKSIVEQIPIGQPAAAGDKNARVTSKTKTVKSSFTVPDEKGESSFHIYNFMEGGFLILAADTRSEPILAFSDQGKMDIEEIPNFPSGLIFWLAQAKDGITYAKANKTERDKRWDTKEMERVLGYQVKDKANKNGRVVDPGPGDGGCLDTFTSVGPYLTTTWSQGCTYNTTLTDNCSLSAQCNKVLTGCVATAMAQIMKGKQKPSSFPWSLMPPSYGTIATANLMKDIGEKVNMDYSCDDGSGAKMEDACQAFKNDYGYVYAGLADYDHNIVKSQLDNGHPVML